MTGFQYDYATAGSGLGNVYVNAKWLFKASGLYNLPGNVNLSAFYNARQGYPFEPFILVSARPTATATERCCSTTSARTGCRITRTSTSTSSARSHRPPRFVPSLDLFNVTNNNTVQALRGQQNAATANDISAVVAPRVLRFGVRVNW